MFRHRNMSLSAKLRTFTVTQLGAMCFYALSGLLLLVFLTLTGFPPHLGFLGILNLVTAYSLFQRRFWTTWLVFILLITNSGFALYTLSMIELSNLLVSTTMILYLVFTWIVSASLLIKRKF
jgi:hypothetical protein